ncbi:MAG: DNA mismatch repair protein MutS [Oscillospiraceae bacterium]|jgi:DNA mismatch repair protein MutS|nr:DNA mismatch repair protein MutS [Oscillospiraceae bacterium]
MAVTPMMRQYFEIKERNPDAILFFRLGDFYEMFGDDARAASRELDLTLTTRDRTAEDPDDAIPMCGVPYHAAESYIARLIAKGYKVAICEQMEDPATAKGLVERDIVRIVTPGTLIDASMLDEGRPNYLCAVYADAGAGGAAVCFAELSTGEISVSELPDIGSGRLENELSAHAPAEAILNARADSDARLRALLTERLGALVSRDDALFERDRARAAVCAQFDVGSPADIGLRDGGAGMCAVGGLLRYITQTQKTDVSHLRTLRHDTGGGYMELDIQTLRNLELAVSSHSGEKRGSLLWVLDRTKTPMGRRLLRSWVLRPLLSPAEITRRLRAVDELRADAVTRGEAGLALREIGDMERLIGRAVYGSAGPRDLKALAYSIARIPVLTSLLAPMRSALLAEARGMDALPDIGADVNGTLGDEPPFSAREGGMIRDGVDGEVDRLRALLKNSSAAMADIEVRERERTGKKLKLGYNRVFGYYIEIPRSSSDDVPDDYTRKQTLANCERFITGELKALESELLTARDRLASLEYELFNQLRLSVAERVARVQDTSSAIAAVDALCSLAETAAQNGYCMPEVDASGVIDIRDGRHPVVEQTQSGTLFVPNDTYLDTDAQRVAIITGPNMAGKSTYMRQTALITLMAQMGSFVPARSARIGVVDRVFTRIGASDDLASGKSTFMVEMAEVADIIAGATRRSLLILDEIGRGTSTFDGMAMARAILEHCADRRALGAKTLFATHYHELQSLEQQCDGVKNYSISAKKRGDDIIFLRKIVPGGADDSYGIEVAKLAGVPAHIIKRAKAALRELESAQGRPPPGGNASGAGGEDSQMSLGDLGARELTERLRGANIDTITPLEALNLLFELKKLI